MPTLSEQVTELVARLQVHLAGLDRPVLVTTGAPLANEGEPGTYALDVVGLALYGPKASSGGAPWGAPSIFGGVDGREVQFDVSATHIRWRYVGDASWTNLIALSVLRGQDGDPGANGWTPVLAVVVDGDRRVQRVVDWTGGAGTKPATGSYVGPLGLEAAIGDATNIRGPAGASGAGTGDVLGPATHANGAVPVWSGANSKTLGAGRAIGVAASTDLLDRAAGDGRYVRTVNGAAPDGNGNVAVSGGGGDAAAVFDYTLHRMRQDMGTSVLETPYGYADPLQTAARLNLVASTGEYFATGHVQNQPTSGDGATPTVASTATLGVGTAATSHSLTGLTGAANGREVIVLVAQDGTGTCSATIGGQAMSELGTTSNANVRLTVLRRNLTGAETNLTITITTSGSTTIAAQAYCIAGMQGTPTVALGTTLFDPPSLTSGFGATNTLWLAVTAHEADRNYFAPGSYTNALVTRANATGDFSGSLCSLASVRRGNAVATEDPGAFSIQGTFGGNSVSATIAIRPGPPAAEAMDLRWTAYDLPADPARLNMQFAVEVLGGTLTLGTTLRGWLSRDAGANFTEATLTPRGPAVGGVQVINAIGVDVSGQPAGDDVVPRITTTAGVTLRVLDMAVLAGG